MIVEPFHPSHLQTLIAQGVHPSQVKLISQAPVNHAPGLAMTARDGEHIVLCGGVIPRASHAYPAVGTVGPHVGILWAVLAADAGRHMLWLHRATLRFLDIEPLRRIEATVEEGFGEGCRWLELMGFESEGPLRAYGLNGETHVLYSRCR